jgi:hypothetical protein
MWRDISGKSMFTFGARFFGTVNTILHLVSLGILAEITLQPTLSKFIKVMVISSESNAKSLDAHDFRQRMRILPYALSSLVNFRIEHIDTDSLRDATLEEIRGRDSDPANGHQLWLQHHITSQFRLSRVLEYTTL